MAKLGLNTLNTMAREKEEKSDKEENTRFERADERV